MIRGLEKQNEQVQDTKKSNRGGARPNAGRKVGSENKVKADFRELWNKAISEENKVDIYNKLYNLASSGDLNAIKLFLEYEVGKPTERKEIVGDADNPVGIKIIFNDLLDDEEDE